jgi:hypothetical protein
MRGAGSAAYALPLLCAACVTGATAAGEKNTFTAPADMGFYVSPVGSDGNPGTLAAPFATLARARQAMEKSAIKTTYLRAGTYNLSSPLTLTESDSGETWRYYPPDGVGTAVLDGGSATPEGISIKGASNVRINGLKLQNFTAYSIIDWPGGTGAIIENNEVGFMTMAPPAQSAASVVGIASSSPGVAILHNYVHDVASIGIQVAAWAAGENVDGSVISGNVVIRAARLSDDNGAIYVNMRHTGDRAGRVTITNNFIRDTGGPGHTTLQDIYLDDNASNIFVTGNILGPFALGVSNRNELSKIYVHNGHNNTVSGNIIDLGSSSFAAPITYGYDHDSIAGMSNNVFERNIILSKFAGRLHSFFGPVAYFEGASWGGAGRIQASWFTIRNNLYWNYAPGGAVFSNGTLAGDASPITGLEPRISGASYSAAEDSPIFSAPLEFPAIAGGWGPPGFTIPDEGTRSPP